MSVKKTLTLPWLEFVKLEGVSSMPLHEQQGLFKKLSDPNYEMPWGQYKNLPHIVNLSLNEQTARYKTYLLELEEVRQEQLALLMEQYKQHDQTQLLQQENLDWLNNYASGQGRGPYRDLGRFNQPPHILLEDGEDLLLEDTGLILLEDA